MQLDAIREALREAGIDGWLFCDFNHRDPLAYSILGLDAGEMTKRRWFYWLPAHGEPVKLAHRVEPRKLDALPGRQEFFVAWGELHERLRAILAGAKRVAMQYSPLNDIPYVALVDAGTIELVRACGPEVVSSADLVQRFEATVGAAGWQSHCAAGDLVLRVKDETFALLASALKDGRALSEHEGAQFILRRFDELGLTADGDVPIVAYNDHAADPHYVPTPEHSHRLRAGDTILVDLWARLARPESVYYDITWCGFAGAAPPAEYTKIFGVARDAREAALDLVRERFAARRTCHGWEVDDAARAVIERGGYAHAVLHRTGHSIGTSVHGNGVNIDNLETRDTRRLAPGSCFSIEPGIYLAGRMGVRTEIDGYVTLDGQVETWGPRQQELILV